MSAQATAATPAPETPFLFPLADLGPKTMEHQRFIPLELIHPSPNNPRKEFDEAGITELAESIKVNGLLKNLVVRPHPRKKEHFELMGGERRWRALRLLKADGAVCKIREATEAESIALQLIENLQVEGVAPMDEAAGYAQLQKLDPAKWSPLNIATAIGKSKRFVLQRLALANNLSPDLKDAINKKKDGLKIEPARIIAALPQSLQKEVLDRHRWRLGNLSAEEVRQTVANHAVLVSAAAFDVALYTGEYIEEGNKRYFGDVAQFNKLQRAAAREKVETLKAKWPDAKLVNESDLSRWNWGDTGSTVKWNQDHKPKGKLPKKCTALVYLDDSTHRIRTVEGVKPAPKPTHTAYSSGPSYKETPERLAEREAFNKALVAAYGKNSGVAMRFMLLDLITGDNGLNIGPAILKRALPGITIRGGWMRDDEKVKFWPHFAALKDAAVLTAIRELAQALVDDDFQDLWGEYEKACPPLMLALGKSLGVAPQPVKPAAEPKAEPKKAGAHEAAPTKRAAPKAKAKAKAKAKKKQ